jgi:hypothetical protein
MKKKQLPSPPLRFWPVPPSDKGLLESLDLWFTKSDENYALHSDNQANELLCRFSLHIKEVVHWTEECHAESDRFPGIDDGNDWLQFVLEVKDYVEYYTQMSDKLQQEMIRIKKSQLNKLEETLLKRLENLEVDCQQIESRIHLLQLST